MNYEKRKMRMSSENEKYQIPRYLIQFIGLNIGNNFALVHTYFDAISL